MISSGEYFFPDIQKLSYDDCPAGMLLPLAILKFGKFLKTQLFLRVLKMILRSLRAVAMMALPGPCVS